LLNGWGGEGANRQTLKNSQKRHFVFQASRNHKNVPVLVHFVVQAVESKLSWIRTAHPARGDATYKQLNSQGQSGSMYERLERLDVLSHG